MPKRVDHEERRRRIADAAARIATTEGLGALTFREVAREAGVSVATVQYYFGTKEQLLIDTLNIRSAVLGSRILGALEALGPNPSPLDRLRTIVTAFVPTDDRSREAMLLYLGFAGAALTDASLRRAEAFANAGALLDTLEADLRGAIEIGEVRVGIDPETEASALLALVLGLSLQVLLDHSTPARAIATLDAHLTLLRAEPA